MTIIDAPLLLTVALLLIVGTAAVWDIRTFTIPNIFPLLVLGLFVVAIPFSAYDLGSFGLHIASGVLAFVVGYILFVFRLMGGGDVKLFAAIAFWVPVWGPVSGFLIFAVAVSFAGSVLAGVVLLIRWLQGLRKSEDVKADTAPLLRTRLPYGVAIFAGTVAAALVGRI